MSLEQELVFQQMDKEYDKQHILDTAEAMKDLGLKVDSGKIETEMRRYELLKNYNSQNNSRRQIKKRKKMIFKDLVNEMIEQLKREDPSVVGYETDRGSPDNCRNCGGYQRYVDVYAIRIKKHIIDKSPIYNKIRESFKGFWYCFDCGKIGTQ